MWQKVVDFLTKFKDILTTIVGFVPLVFLIIDTVSGWNSAGDKNIGTLLMALAVAIVGWFTGKGKVAVK